MSHRIYEKGKSLIEGRNELKEVIMECSSRFTHSQEEMVMTMLAIANESYPEPGYIKDGNSDYQVQKTVLWTSAMGDIEDVKDKLVDRMESNDFDPNDSDLQRGRCQCNISLPDTGSCYSIRISKL